MAAALVALIADRIRTRGPMTVAEYVRLALYHPDHGYYARAPQRSGRGGDFFTSVDLGPMFGELLCVQLAQMWRIIRERGAAVDAAPVPFDLVEAGAGNGRLSRDIADAAAAQDPDFLAAVRLHLVEESALARAEQARVLGPHVGRLASSGPDLPTSTRGVILANELLDALPPHLVVMRRGGLREIFVDQTGGRLFTREQEPSTPRLARHLDEVGAHLEPGWFAEVNLAASEWVANAARSLERGFLLFIDYGHEARELYSGTHSTGTLMSFRAHASESRESGPGWLSEPGERDLTSHVDLTGIRLAAEAEGLDTIGVIDQTYFLLGLGLEGHLARAETDPASALKQRLALKTLLLPGGMGSTYKVMIFARGVGRPALRGTSFGHRLT